MAYTTRAKLETMFGAENVKAWADLNNAGVDGEIAARITAAIDYADGEIDDYLRGSMYTVPIVLTAGTGTPPTLIDVANRLAGVWLYELRLIEDTNPDTGEPVYPLAHHKKAAYGMLKQIATGTRLLDAATTRMIPEITAADS
jgi:phage gp36-like protein